MLNRLSSNIIRKTKLVGKPSSGYHTMSVRCILPPDLSSVTEGMIDEILCKENEHVKKNQVIMKIGTHKVVLDQCALATGTIRNIFVKNDQKVVDGTPLYRIDVL